VSWLQGIAEVNEQDWRPVGTPAFFAATLLGWLGVLIAWGWLARRWWLDRELGQH